MPDSRDTASAFPTAASAGSRTLRPLFSPTHFDEDPLFVSVMGSNSVGYARRATGLDAPSTLLLANVLDCLLGKGGLM
jgi:hypothetical protein